MIEKLLSWLEKKEKINCHRYLVVMSGDEQWCKESLLTLTHKYFESDKSILSCGFELPDIEHTNATKYKQYLGREFDHVIYNGHQGIRLSALSGLVGTVKANGILFLICPELEHWANVPDLETQNRVSYGFEQQPINNYFIQSLSQRLLTDPRVVKLSKRQFFAPELKEVPSCPSQTGSCATTAQMSVIDAVEKVAKGHRNRPLVINADRGRGKSASLGFAADQLITRHGLRIAVTSARTQSIQNLYKHAKRDMDDPHLIFKAVDDLLRNKPEFDLVLIDEAAAIPVTQLKALYQIYKRTVFSTTTHGYEGTGRGFEIRFKPFLQKKADKVASIRLTQPIRWSEGDYLEQFVSDALHLQPNNEKITLPIETEGALHFVYKKRLLEDPVLLNQVFSLLVDSHYQTSPDDLLALMDAPEQQLFIITSNGKLTGAILTVEEGCKFNVDISEQIVCGNRRVRGHLIPQQLALNTSDANYLQFRYLRIQRIAIASEMRRKGIGKEALTQLKQWARAHEFDGLGTSFGASEELFEFWCANDFALAHFGYHRDKATAEYSALMLCPITDSLNSSLESLKRNARNSFGFHAHNFYQNLDKSLLFSVLKSLANTSDINQIDLDKLRRFSQHNLSLEIVAPVLQKISWDHRCYHGCGRDESLLIASIGILRLDIKSAVEYHKLIGKAELIAGLRNATAKYLSLLP